MTDQRRNTRVLKAPGSRVIRGVGLAGLLILVACQDQGHGDEAAVVTRGGDDYIVACPRVEADRLGPPIQGVTEPFGPPMPSWRLGRSSG